MTAGEIFVEPVDRKEARKNKAAMAAAETAKRISSPGASIIAIILAVLWTIPTFGLLVTSFRPGDVVPTSGWWTAFTAGGGGFTFNTYKEAWTTQALGPNFLNSFVITLPAILIPITLALLAAYAFAWVDFRGRNFLFVAVFALQIVPIQVTLLPLLKTYKWLGLDGSFWPVWLSHTIYGLPLAIFLMHNFMKEIPREIVEAARVDGAGHVKIFFKVLMPLLVPAIAAFGIFQFLWVWNDLLVGTVFSGSKNNAPLPLAVQQLIGNLGSGNRQYLLSAGAFIVMAVPLVIFLALQRFFVRGLLAGGVKG
ncbi:carbohydrate ABC transporter permease [Nakamurella silvestris]|nr:carbohydrate ABC transporter permease [Nakamurella silvestris]